MESKTSKYAQAVVVVCLFVIYELASTLYNKSQDDVHYIDEVEFRRKIDSVIGPKNERIAMLEHRVNERDSLLFGLSLIETIERDGVFVSLEDRFETATDSARESLISEALNDIRDEE
tara:strand:+ start:55 stop:408 length:354 start_codon:yes stop_codon:yes gene_type:complete